MSNNETLSGGDLTRTAARWFMGARGGLEVTRADMQNARCLLGDLLRAVADDLDAQADDDDCNCQTTTDWTVCDCIASLTAKGVRDAADRVRDLGAIVQYAPLPIHRTEAEEGTTE